MNEVFLELLDVTNAERILDFPTRGDNTLDLLLTNRVSLLNKCCGIPGLGDHQTAILADIECHSKKQKPISRKIYLWKKANHEYLHETIQQNVELFNFLWCHWGKVFMHHQWSICCALHLKFPFLILLGWTELANLTSVQKSLFQLNLLYGHFCQLEHLVEKGTF